MDDENSWWWKSKLLLFKKENVGNSEKVKKEKGVPSTKHNHDYSQSFSEKWVCLPAQSQSSTTTGDPSML